MLEKVIKNILVSFLEKQKIFYDYQYGFREKRSVLHALLDVITPGYDAIEQNKFTALLLMDLRKAFDTVSHRILLHKVLHYGIRGHAYTLIESYLCDRQQFVSVNNVESSPKPISIGVPQGSILDPLLFLIYINDLPNAISCQPRLFADDTCLIAKNSALNELEIKCNSELRNLNQWCCANKLQINPEKSKAIIVSPKLNTPQPELNLLYNTANISLNDSCKYLGVILDNKLNFQLHIFSLEKRASRSVGILSKLRFLFPSSTLLLLYHVLVHPNLLYGLPIWGGMFKTYLDKLQILQNKAIRVITNSDRRSSITPQFRNLNVLKIAYLYTYEIAKLMHQYSRNMLPPCFSTFFTSLSEIHDRQSRSKSQNNLYLPKFSTCRCQRSLRFQGVKIWNSLSPDLKKQSHKKFKISLKNPLLESYAQA